MTSADFDLDACVEGVLSADRTWLGRAVTVVESTRPEDRVSATDLLQRLLPHTGGARRVGITGVPGVGKSTFIEALGTLLTSKGHRVAVLAVDPSSSVSGGSILGDKTRMPNLAVDEAAYIRPSPSSGSLGGVARATRETMAVVEAAGFDVVLVETVGVGQSETAVADMVDFFLVLLLPGAGDELQGIKKGVLELADALVVNKADGGNEIAAQRAVRDYRAALAMTAPANPRWVPPVLAISAIEGTGLDQVWDQIQSYYQALADSGDLARLRAGQQVRWMWAMVENRLLDRLRGSPEVADLAAELEHQVASGQTTPAVAADQILTAFDA
ncbi:MAG: methylmalonyl Co-A mutase-associated GTPase MeaB [bacterium]|nr:methylmalonyl Co-A mutase-associated GTPase MeaB [bacterium]MCY4193338.1 methylmalonyl Co-A mutase-associated GTPase MeaB [bacterium]MCY4271216.1 methylmalonyl Co-A mutase-associated GTPase MeaB [bacterium]